MTTYAEKIEASIDEMKNTGDIKDFVNHVENSVPITQNNYDKYLAIISSADGTVMKTALSIVLKELGANEDGVNSALLICNIPPLSREELINLAKEAEERK